LNKVFSNRYEESTIDTRREKRMTINSIILGLFLSVSMITKLITTVVAFDNNIIVFVGLLLIVSFFTNGGLRISKPFVCINLLVVAWFGISMGISMITNTVQSHAWTYMLSYVLYGVVGMLFCSVPLHFEKVFKTISFVFIPYTAYLLFLHIPLMLKYGYLVESMDISYTLLHGVCAVLICWKSFSKLFKCIFAILLAISVYYIFFLSSCRGAVLSLAVFVLILYMSQKKHKAFRVFLIFSIAIFLFLFWEDIFGILYQWFPDANWLNRILYSADFSSGRDDIYRMAINLVDRNLLFGVGIGGFESYADGTYTHNLFLQMFCEMGLPLGLIVSAILSVWIVRSILKKDDSFENKFQIFLICQFIPRLLLSSVYWLNSFIWIYIFLRIMFFYTKKNSVEKTGEILQQK